jgi:hypothetical protein
MTRKSLPELPPMGHPESEIDSGDDTEICTLPPDEPPKEPKVC